MYFSLLQLNQKVYIGIFLFHYSKSRYINDGHTYIFGLWTKWELGN